jgi:hypothetical protein
MEDQYSLLFCSVDCALLELRSLPFWFWTRVSIKLWFIEPIAKFPCHKCKSVSDELRTVGLTSDLKINFIVIFIAGYIFLSEFITQQYNYIVQICNPIVYDIVEIVLFWFCHFLCISSSKNIKSVLALIFFSLTCPKAKFRQNYIFIQTNFFIIFTCPRLRASGLARRLKSHFFLHLYWF